MRKSWKKEPSAPRIEVSPISDINMGATTHAPPVAIPAKTRAAYSIDTLDAVTVNIQVRRKGRLSSILVYFRPSLSARIPAGIAPTNAPMASREPTQDSEREEKKKKVWITLRK